MDKLKIIPTWAPRVTQREIRRLYETDAKGIYDEDLINEVGYGLLSRCQSFIEANEARAGNARCANCSATAVHSCDMEEILRCDCGWELSWKEYFKTIQHKQLSGAEPVLAQFRTFINKFSIARTPQQKILAIDRLIHGFHWYYKTNSPIRPVAVNLIEGSMSGVVAFLDQLTNGVYGDKSTPGIRENFAEWDKKIEANRDLYRSRRKKEAQPKNAPDKK
jgi:hypothetical protein